MTRSARHQDSGLTLVETLVAVSLFTVLGSLVLGCALALMTLNGGSIVLNNAASQLTVATGTIGNKFRSANRFYDAGDTGAVVGSSPAAGVDNADPYYSPFYKGCGAAPTTVQAISTGNELWMFADLGNPFGLSVVHYYLNVNADLVEEITPPNGKYFYTYNGNKYSGVGMTCRIVARGVITPGSGFRPLFTYYATNAIYPLNTINPNDPIGDSANKVAAIEVSLTIQGRGRGKRPVTSSLFVPFPQAIQDQQATGPGWVVPPTNPYPPPGTGAAAGVVPAPPAPSPAGAPAAPPQNPPGGLA